MGGGGGRGSNGGSGLSHDHAGAGRGGKRNATTAITAAWSPSCSAASREGRGCSSSLSGSCEGGERPAESLFRLEHTDVRRCTVWLHLASVWNHDFGQSKVLFPLSLIDEAGLGSGCVTYIHAAHQGS